MTTKRTRQVRRAKKRMGLAPLRDILADYGVRNTETIRQGVARLIEEHRQALERATTSEAAAAGTVLI